MTDSDLPPAYPGSGEIVDGKYRIEKLLGEGGMGAVARATHVVLGGTLALKFMNPQFMTFPGAVERFVNEGRASKAIKSDHVLPVTDVGMLPNGTPYLLMECLYGVDLADLLARDGPSGLPIQRAVHFVLQILRGLQAAHAIGIIHRDMKPSNCFVVTHDGEADFIKILDFGISKVVQPGSASLTQTNSALGTPLYMSPEQARSPRDVDRRSDIYSVGVILYELLSGHTPFFSESGEFTEILFQLFTADPPPIQQTRPEVPDALAAIVHKALAREAEDRYATALELAEALVLFAAPKSLHLVERMQNFKPPSTGSIAPMDGLPTSMAAFSQLKRGPGTDVMGSGGSRTDVQKGSPVTEILIDAPRPMHARQGQGPQHTELLHPQNPSTPPPPARLSAAPELFSARARPDEAFGRTQLERAPGGVASTGAVASESAARALAAAQTDLGASRDTTANERASTPGASKRSPLMFALPLTAVVAVIGGAVLFVKLTSGPDVKPVATSEPPPSALVSLALPSASVPPVIASAPSSVTSVASAPSSVTSPPTIPTTAHTTAPTKTTAPGHTFIPGLDNGIRN